MTAVPAAAEAQPVRFDRPILITDIELPGGTALTVVNVHLRAPLAASVPGQKLEPFVWKSVGGWAEGTFLSALRRTGQALELRLLLEQLLDADAHRLIAVAGDFNAEDHEVPLRIVIGAEEDTGNGALAGRSLVLLDRAIPEDRRWSVLHHGRREMLDHILVSRACTAGSGRPTSTTRRWPTSWSATPSTSAPPRPTTRPSWRSSPSSGVRGGRGLSTRGGACGEVCADPAAPSAPVANLSNHGNAASAAVPRQAQDEGGARRVVRTEGGTPIGRWYACFDVRQLDRAGSEVVIRM